MASAEDKAELAAKLTALVKARQGATHAKAWARMWHNYDGDKDGRIDRDELLSLLSDADVGNGFTRGFWADGIIDELDQDHNQGIGLDELISVIKSPPGKPIAPALPSGNALSESAFQPPKRPNVALVVGGSLALYWLLQRR